MLEIFALVASVSGIAALARGRGASAVVAGTAAAVGYVVILFAGAIVLRGVSGRVFILELLAWSWVGLVALYVRFGIGRGHPQPDSKWSCSNCHFLNNRSAVVCEACQTPWKS